MMAWSQVDIKIGSTKAIGFFNGSHLDAPNIGDVENEVVISNKKYTVVSVVLDERDNRYNIEVAMATSKKIKEQSDGKSIKGPS